MPPLPPERRITRALWAIFALQLIMGLAIASLALKIHVETMMMDAKESAMESRRQVNVKSIREDRDMERLRQNAVQGHEEAYSHWQAIRSITHDLRDGTLGLVVAAFATAGVAWYGLRARKTGSDA